MSELASPPPPGDSDDELRSHAVVATRLFGAARTPARIAGYEILERVGEGAMGVVFAARDDQLERTVALKVLSSRRHGDPRQVRRLLGEAKALARLSHPNVVTVHDAGVDATGPYIAMELIDGEPLSTWLTSAARSRRAIVDVFIQAAQGLEAAHRAGLVHRDFKPSNVLVGRDGVARVADFGLARAGSDDPRPSQDEEEANTPATLTRTGEVVGTPLYVAPEQCAGGPVDARADQFALCVALHEALTGRLPYDTGHAADLRVRKRNGTLEVRIDPGLPRATRAILQRGASPSPDDRFADLGDLVEALRTTQRGGRRWVLAGAFGVVAVAGFGVSHSQSDAPVDRVHPVDPCVALEQQLGQADGLADLAQASEDAAGSSWERPAAFARGRLEGYQASWVQARLAVCEAASAGQAVQAHDARVECLTDARSELDATAEHVVGMLTRRTAPDPSALVRLVEGLPPLSRCARAPQPGERPVDAQERDASRALMARARKVMRRHHAGLAISDADFTAIADADAESRSPWARAVCARALALAPGADAVGVLRAAAVQAGYTGEPRLLARIELDLARELKDNDLDAADAVLDSVAATLAEVETDNETIALRGELALHRGTVAEQRGDPVAFERHTRQALEHWTQLEAFDPINLLQARNNLALSLRQRGASEPAREMFEAALADARRVLPEQDDRIAELLNNLGGCHLDLGNHGEAMHFMRDALAALPAHAEPVRRGRMHYNLALIEAEREDLDSAEQDLERAHAIFSDNLGHEHVLTHLASVGIAMVLRERGAWQQALARQDAAIAGLERAATRPWLVAQARLERAETLHALQRLELAAADLARARSLLESSIGLEGPAGQSLLAQEAALATARMPEAPPEP